MSVYLPVCHLMTPINPWLRGQIIDYPFKSHLHQLDHHKKVTTVPKIHTMICISTVQIQKELWYPGGSQAKCHTAQQKFSGVTFWYQCSIKDQIPRLQHLYFLICRIWVWAWSVSYHKETSRNFFAFPPPLVMLNDTPIAELQWAHNRRCVRPPFLEMELHTFTFRLLPLTQMELHTLGWPLCKAIWSGI